MATLTVQDHAEAGVTPTFAAVASGGDTFANDGKTYVEFVNSSGANAYTVTLVTAGTYKGQAVADLDVVIAVSARKKIGPFRKDVYNNGSGRIVMTYSGTAPATDLTAGIFRLTPTAS